MTLQPASIRPAVLADLPELTSADPLAADGDAERAEFLASMVSSSACLVYVDASGLAGFVVTRRAHFFGRDFIELLMVHPDRRRCGVGRRLLRAAVSEASTADIFSSTNRSNEPMRCLFESEGWTFSGELTGLDHGDPELVFFARTLASGG